MQKKKSPSLCPRQCSTSLPFFPIPLYHFPRLFTTNTRAALPELIMKGHAAKVLPSPALPSGPWRCRLDNPASKNTGVVVRVGWGGGGVNCLMVLVVLVLMRCCGGCMMSSCGTEGANQTLRKLCHLLLSRSIQGYRSAVNWELQRGHFSPHQSCVYVYVCEKKKKEKCGGGRQAEKCIVGMLMLLTIKMSPSSTCKLLARRPSLPNFYVI